MANKITIDIEVNGKMQKATVSAKKLKDALNETSRSAKETERNTKGLAQTASAGGKNFSKMASGISGGLVPAYAALAANVFALTAAFNFLKSSSQVALLERSQVAYASNTGVALDRLTGSLREASKGMLDFQAAAQASAIGLAKGFSSSQMDSIAEGALKVSNALGRDFTDSFDRLVRGISKAEPELLDELGITLRLETATKNYAAALGKSAKELTAAERSQAVYLETMKQLEDVTAGADAEANPFVQLGVTMSDLVKNIMQFLLPAFEALAKFINSNAVAALGFFALLGASVLKSMPFVEKLTGSFKEFASAQKTALADSRKELESYRQKLQQVKNTAEQSKAMGAAQVKSGAQGAISAGAQSPVLMRAALGTMKGADQANLKKALKSAEAQYTKSGAITKGIFKGVSIDVVRSMSGGFKQIEAANLKTTKTIGTRFKIIGMQAKAAGMRIRTAFTSAFAKAGKAVNGFGKAMNLAMKATVILGLIQMIYDLVVSIATAPHTILKNVIGIGTGAVGILQSIANTVIDVINYIINQVNRLPGIEIATLNYKTFGDDFKKDMDTFLETSEFALNLKKREEKMKTRQTELDTIKAIKEELPEVEKAISKIMQGKLFDPDDKDFAKNTQKRMEATAKAMSSLGIEGLFADALTIKDPARQKKAIKAIGDGLADDLEKLSPKFAAAVRAGDAQLVGSMVANAGAFTANIAEVEDQIASMSTTLSGKGAEGTRVFLEMLMKTGNAAVLAGSKIGLTTDVVDQLNAAFENKGGIDSYIASLRQVEQKTQEIAQNRHLIGLDTIGTSRQSGALASQTGLQRTADSAELNLQEKRNNLQKIYNENRALMDTTQKVEHDNRVAEAIREIELAEKKAEVAKVNATELGQLGQAIGDSLTSSMQSAFDGLIQGTMTAKEAFASMATSMLQSIAKVIAELLTAKLLTAALGGSSFGSFLGIPAGKTGGVFSNGGKVSGYATGGVAKGPGSGYPAILHGTEAVVPLPNGKSIPVDMKNAGQNNNVTVNVSMNGQGGAQQNTQSDGSQGANLGAAIAAAVQKELHNQKRAGGILNPMGAS